MKAVLPLFIMIDACGWEIVNDKAFLRNLAPNRQRLESVFGYSSACVPSILSGRWPSEHRNWCYFVYDPKNSPFKSLAAFRWLPRKLTGRRIVRRLLTRLVRHRLNFKGYFDLYNIPFKHIALYDFSEKKSPLKPKGMNCGPNIFDYLEGKGIPYSVSDPDQGEEHNYRMLLDQIASEQIDFAFSYWPELDGLLHRVGNDSPEIGARLWSYERALEKVMEVAQGHYQEVWLYVFSDHGQANCDELLDLQAKINALSVKMGKDYVVVYDSTMARFWFFNEEARRQIGCCLAAVPQGRILGDDELKRLGAFFPDHHFGEMIFLVKEGVLIVPSHMGERPIRAMHGYHPSERHSYAALFSNHPIPERISAIPHIYNLMTEMAGFAYAANHQPATGAQS